MPGAAKVWRHVIISARGSWLPGDIRGFRTRGHKIHSSGDYKNPPPKEEHQGLRRYSKKIGNPVVEFPRDVRPVIGQVIIHILSADEYRVLVVAVAAKHAHFLVELPNYMPEIRVIVGEAKRKSSRAVKHILPGSIWGSGGKYKAVLSRAHQFRAFEYILYEQGQDAWTWSARDRSPEGRFGRKRPRSSKHLTSPGRAKRRPG